MSVCEIEGCNRAPRSQRGGMCGLHYNRWYKTGQAGEPGLLRRENGTGRIDSNGYHQVTVDGQRVGMHRLVMEQRLGRPLCPDESVHHRNGNRADNRIENLELWSRYQPSGQRTEDKVIWATEILARYAPHMLAHSTAVPAVGGANTTSERR